MNRAAPSNMDDLVDSRDIIARISALEERVEDEDYQGELDDLKALADEASQYAADWTYGEALIRDSHFEDYAKELASDTAPTHEIAELIRNDGRGDYWPLTFAEIDWGDAVEALQKDYTEVDWAGVTYWIR